MIFGDIGTEMEEIEKANFIVMLNHQRFFNITLCNSFFCGFDSRRLHHKIYNKFNRLKKLPQKAKPFSIRNKLFNLNSNSCKS